ncbi:MAG TPA: universal stress protein [Marinagarivorans sp.]
MKKILVQIKKEACDEQITLAASIGKTLKADVNYLYLHDRDFDSKPDMVAALAVAGPQPVMDASVVTDRRVEEELLVKQLQEKVSRIINPSGKHGRLIVSHESPRDAFMHHGLYHDLLIVDKDLKTTDVIGLIYDGVSDVAAHCHRPVFALPKHAKPNIASGDVLIVWNSDPETASAIGHALPLLQLAHNVTLLFLHDGKQSDKTETDLQMEAISYLKSYDINAQALHCPEDADANEAFLSRVLDGQFDYVVAAAYGHSKLRELFSGNIVREVLRRTQVPVFLAT